MTIREATAADVDRIVAMGERFIANVYPADVVANPAQIAKLAAQLIESPDGDIYLAILDEQTVGMIALHAYPHPMSGERIATELCWWVEPEHRGVGVSLYKIAEAWARAQNAALFQMIAPSPAVARFYQRMGFKAIETTYQRRVA